MKDKILSICDEDGNRLEDPKAVKGEILRFYKQMLGSKLAQKRPSLERLCFVHTVPNSFHDALIAPITPAEIKVALFVINGDKSPGPDGYNSSFFQKNWELKGYFKGEKGLRQGGPISSYLFLMVMEGLYAILQKKISQDLFSGVEEFVKADTLNLFPIPEGTLQVRYLDVPLISTRLRYEDCVQLKDRTQQRIASWTNSRLSYGGRALLIQSEIEVMLRAFLWSGIHLKKIGAKVRWLEVCSPKAEGGLGLKSLQVWNKATMLRHLWALCKKEDTLWVKWVHSYMIRDQNMWAMKVPQDCSWTVRKLLKLRRVGQPFVKHIIEDGCNTFIWFVNWHPKGPLYKLLDDRSVATM
ncbi:uncharacterized protein LOC131313995 [Rhododendron vialii]|uniref:uncharacterized protein LOC131313995 n=1 Tax=Rhododendron vialii TaxID=182163 RepID=UPI00265EC9B9|nr:uncharacterized protein LOC131313995 [Rhododendron vialii]